MSILEFEYLCKDAVGTYVRADLDTGEVEVEDYSSFPFHQFFAKRPHSIEELYKVLERRCFPKTQDGADEILACLGLQEYNVLDIVRRTHGRLHKDKNWIRFTGEDLCWADVEKL